MESSLRRIQNWIEAGRPLIRLYAILFEKESQLSEFNIAVFTLMWGIWLLFSSVAASDPLPNHRILGSVCTLIGVGKHFGMYRNNIYLRRFFSMCALLLWAYVACYVFQANRQDLMMPTTLVIAWWSALTFLRLGRHRPASEVEHVG
jgi:hypothetical protein